MKMEIVNCLSWYVNKVAETVQYTEWSDEMARHENRKYMEMMLEELKRHIDWNNLTREEALELRFKLWDEEQPDLYLIPLYLLPIVPFGTELTSITGDKILYNGHNVDNDVRFGCVAFGIEIKE